MLQNNFINRLINIMGVEWEKKTYQKYKGIAKSFMWIIMICL